VRQRHRRLTMMVVLIAAVTGAAGKAAEQLVQIGFDSFRHTQVAANYSEPIGTYVSAPDFGGVYAEPPAGPQGYFSPDKPSFFSPDKN
jgi:hypothetical protein